MRAPLPGCDPRPPFWVPQGDTAALAHLLQHAEAALAAVGSVKRAVKRALMTEDKDKLQSPAFSAQWAPLLADLTRQLLLVDAMQQALITCNEASHASQADPGLPGAAWRCAADAKGCLQDVICEQIKTELIKAVNLGGGLAGAHGFFGPERPKVMQVRTQAAPPAVCQQGAVTDSLPQQMMETTGFFNAGAAESDELAGHFLVALTLFPGDAVPARTADACPGGAQAADSRSGRAGLIKEGRVFKTVRKYQEQQHLEQQLEVLVQLAPSCMTSLRRLHQRYLGVNLRPDLERTYEEMSW